MTDIINSDSQLEVIGTAADPYFAAQKLKSTIPDVITLDVEMPRMDGLTFLKALMAQYPIPVVIISSLTQHGSQLAGEQVELLVGDGQSGQPGDVGDVVAGDA